MRREHVNCVTHNEIRQFNIDFSKTKLSTWLLIRITMRNFIRYEREQEEDSSSSAATINRPLLAATQQRGLSELRPAAADATDTITLTHTHTHTL